jgi:hypothetical protein
MAQDHADLGRELPGAVHHDPQAVKDARSCTRTRGGEDVISRWLNPAAGRLARLSCTHHSS